MSHLTLYSKIGKTRLVRVSLGDRIIAAFGGAMAGPLMTVVCLAFGMQSSYWQVLLAVVSVTGAIAGPLGQFFYLTGQRLSRRDFIRRDRLNNLIAQGIQEVSLHYVGQPDAMAAAVAIEEVKKKLYELLNGY